MKLICRKCGLEWAGMVATKKGKGPNAETGSIVHSFEEVDKIQKMTCGAGGTHRLVGRA